MLMPPFQKQQARRARYHPEASPERPDRPLAACLLLFLRAVDLHGPLQRDPGERHASCDGARRRGSDDTTAHCGRRGSQLCQRQAACLGAMRQPGLPRAEARAPAGEEVERAAPMAPCTNATVSQCATVSRGARPQWSAAWVVPAPLGPKQTRAGCFRSGLASSSDDRDA